MKKSPISAELAEEGQLPEHREFDQTIASGSSHHQSNAFYL